MQYLRIFALVALCVGIFITASASSAEGTASRFFESELVLSEKNYVLNDFVEFSLFDMSEMTFVDSSGSVITSPASPETVPAPSTKTTTTISKNKTAKAKTKTGSAPDGTTTPLSLLPSPPPPMSPALDPAGAVVESATGLEITSGSIAAPELKDTFKSLPRLFYKSLKKEILRQRVPVTLYPTDSPAFAKPLKLYIKVKSVQLRPSRPGRRGETMQPVTVRIYGQIKDKASDTVLFKFYDTQSDEFTLGAGQAPLSMGRVALTMMENLAAFLKTKY